MLGSFICLAELPAGLLVRADSYAGPAWRSRVDQWYRWLLLERPALPAPTAEGLQERPAGLAVSDAPAEGPQGSTADEEERAGLLPAGAEPGAPAPAEVELKQSPLALSVAWLILALTAGVGIVCTVVMERQMGIGAFGYAAMDQVLLPFTTLPLTIAAVRWPSVADWIGEPAAGRDASVLESFSRTWREVDWISLVPFRGLMFGREFLFFWLATAFPDLSGTYLEMTILRVVLCWLGSLLVSARFRAWAGVSDSEATVSLHPTNLTLRIVGTVVLVLSYARVAQ